MDRAEKRELIDALNASFKGAGVIVVSHYQGLTVADLQAYRARMREAGGKVKVAKNRLAKLALQGTDAEHIADLFTGPTIIAYSADPVGTPGNKVKGSYLWGKDIVMAYVPPAPGKKVPAFGYEYTWTINGQEMSVDRWREDPRVSDLIRLRRRYDLKLTGVEIDPDSPDFGKSISGYLIKNAVA